MRTSGALLLLLGLVAGCGDSPDASKPAAVHRMAGLLAFVPREAIVRLSAEDTLHVSESTRHFYRWRLYRSAWTDGTTLLPQGQEIYTALGNAGDDGLDPRSYGWSLAHVMVDRLGTGELGPAARAKLLGELDLVLSEGFGRYARDLIQGTLDPAKDGLDWRVARDTTLTLDVLKAARTEAVGDLVARLRPSAPFYGRLMGALARYRAVDARGGWPRVPAEVSAKGGKLSATTTTALRLRLTEGEDSTESALAAWGAGRPEVFDDSLRSALVHFQGRNAIDEDGAMGANTIRELNQSVEDRIADLRLNLDRWRWLPRDLGARYVVVNVAGFELELIEDGKPTLVMNVVVGREGWNTPLFADTIESLVVNPSWSVPPSIVEAEILPAILKNPRYLADNHFDVLRGERVVDPATVDWANAKGLGFRQRPGADNALGRFKFLLPNADNIYLHDTQAGRLFSVTDRAFSHGCIRLEQPDALARVLLERVTDVGPDALAAKLASGAETTIRFREGVPVYIVYFTAWVDQDGDVRFPHDVYGRDQKLELQREEKLDHPTGAGGAAVKPS